ncbi:RcnB family protein [Roseibium sp.]|uniref:RcnB family protein n=1 Tax=Roseibium sp. TaxID=1936156 RepID=UPI003A981E8F
MTFTKIAVSAVLALSLAVPATSSAFAAGPKPDCHKQGECRDQKGHASKQAPRKQDTKAQHTNKDHKKDAKQQQHASWHRKGGKMPNSAKWSKVDYRKHGLKKPPQNHRWVRYNNEYVLIAIGSGVIASIIAANN